MIKYENGREERQTLVGENLADVAPGYLPRTLDQLRRGVTSDQVGPRNLNPTLHNVNTTAVDSPEFDPEDRIFDTPQASPPRTNLYAPYSWRYPHRESLGWPHNVPPSNHDQIGRVAVIRTQLERIRLGIESVISQLHELRGVFPASQYAIQRTSDLRTRMAHIQNFLTSTGQDLDPSTPVATDTGLNMDPEPMEWSTDGGLHTPNTGATRPATSLQNPPGLDNTPRHDHPYLAPSFRIPPTDRPHPFGNHFTQHPATTSSSNTNSAPAQRQMNAQADSAAAGSSTSTRVALASATPDNVRLRLDTAERELTELRQRRDRARAAENTLVGRQREAMRMMEIANTQREIAMLERQRAERRYDDVEQAQRQNVRVWGVQGDVAGQESEYVSPITSMFMSQSQRLRPQHAVEDAPPPPVYDPLAEAPRAEDIDRMMDTSPSPPPPDVRDPAGARGPRRRHRFRTFGHGHNHQESESEDEHDPNHPLFPSENFREELLRRAGVRAGVGGGVPASRSGRHRARPTDPDSAEMADVARPRVSGSNGPRAQSPRSATAEAARLFSVLDRARLGPEPRRPGAVTADSIGRPDADARRRRILAGLSTDALPDVATGHRRPPGPLDLNPQRTTPHLHDFLGSQGLSPGSDYQRALAVQAALRQEMTSDIRNTPIPPRRGGASRHPDIGRELRGEEIAAARAYLDIYRREENKPVEVKSLDKEDDDRPDPVSEEQMMVKMECKICFAQVATVAMLPCGESLFPSRRRWHSDVGVMLRNSVDVCDI